LIIRSRSSLINKVLFLCVFVPLWPMLFSACGVPNLDPPECSASRTVVREFYSFHFGNDMRFSEEGLKQRERYLSPALIDEARKGKEGTDPFTTGDADFPKAFRAGECRVISPDRTSFDLLLFWKDDVRSEQRKIKVEAVKSGAKWLIDKIEK
jgi:hypothetical protein